MHRKRLARTVLIFTERSDQLSMATDRVPGLPASPGYAPADNINGQEMFKTMILFPNHQVYMLAQLLNIYGLSSTQSGSVVASSYSMFRCCRHCCGA